MQKLKYSFFLLFLVLTFPACKKESLLQETKKIVKVQIKGYIMTDTLEFVVNGKSIIQAIDNSFQNPGDGSNIAYLNAGDEIFVRKKAGGKAVGKFNIQADPFAQEKKFFYDGTTLTDNLELTPVSDPNNYGLKLQFSTNFVDFYGGPVDIEFFEQVTTTTRPRVTTYESVKLITSVTNKFSDFYELPPIQPEAGKLKSYVFKVYKTGTKELPYTKMDNVDISDPENFYVTLLLDSAAPIPGASMLISISPVLTDENGNTTPTGTRVFPDYALRDFASVFR